MRVQQNNCIAVAGSRLDLGRRKFCEVSLQPFGVFARPIIMPDRFVNIHRNTPVLLPPDLPAWVPEHHLTHFLLEAVVDAESPLIVAPRVTDPLNDKEHCFQTTTAIPTAVMRHRVSTRKEKAKYKLRRQTVEPVIGIIEGAMEIRRYSLHGVAKVGSEWALVCLANTWIGLFL